MKIFALLALPLLALGGCDRITATSESPSLVQGEYRLVSRTEPRCLEKAEIEQIVDFTCPGCYKASKGMPRIKEEYKERIVLRIIPIQLKPKDDSHLRLYHIAVREGKNAEVTEALYAAQFERKLDILAPAVVLKLAAELGVADAYQTQRNAPWVDAAIKRDLALARTYRVSGTPTWVVDGQFNVQTNFVNLRTVLNDLLLP